MLVLLNEHEAKFCWDKAHKFVLALDLPRRGDTSQITAATAVAEYIANNSFGGTIHYWNVGKPNPLMGA